MVGCIVSEVKNKRTTKKTNLTVNIGVRLLTINGVRVKCGVQITGRYNSWSFIC